MSSVFSSENALGLDPGWKPVRLKNTRQIKNLTRPDSIQAVNSQMRRSDRLPESALSLIADESLHRSEATRCAGNGITTFQRSHCRKTFHKTANDIRESREPARKKREE